VSGHSKWHNRIHRKSRQDAKKGAVYSKMAKEITLAARSGGGDPEGNTRLRLAIDRAREAGVPADNIKRAVERGSGAGADAANFEELLYEGYGPGGVAILLEIATDNRNPTAGEIRYLFSRNGGNLGESGSVAWMFDRKGLLTVERGPGAPDEERMLELALEAGAEDVRTLDDAFEVVTAPSDFYAVKAALEGHGVSFADAGLTMIPKNQIRVEPKDAETLAHLVELLEEHEDVQEVHTNLLEDEAEVAL
jgi:YebC/PmpR family DNA-binding regulatory protein